MNFTLHHGDCRDVLRGMAAESVHAAITSPPYWGLRAYEGVKQSWWGGKQHCRHRLVQNVCTHCGAWWGLLGLERTPDQFLANTVEVFREVRRVLRADGTLWLNVGDSYVTKPSNHGSSFDPKYAGGRDRPAEPRANRTDHPEEIGLQNKDLCMMPARVALALQADGWILRSQIPWIKFTPLPESVLDRPTSAIEYIYQFVKQEEYYYDKEAVRVAASGNAHALGNGVNPKARMPGPNSRMSSDKDPYHQLPSRIRAKQNRSYSAAVIGTVSTRARRNSEWFTEGLEAVRRGLLQDEAGDPLAMLVNAEPFSVEMCAECDTCFAQKDYRKLEKVLDGEGQERRKCTCDSIKWVSHFATYPRALVTPLILSSTSEFGCCSHCGAPYVRVLEEKAHVGDWHPDPKRGHDKWVPNGTSKWSKGGVAKDKGKPVTEMGKPHAISGGGTHTGQVFPAPATIGWKATCDHPLFPGSVKPCVVLDPFNGSGRTGLAALALGREYVGIDASEEYITMARWQLQEFTKSLKERVAVDVDAEEAGIPA